MKYLSDYTNDAVTTALNFYGAFFAFSTEQFEAQRVPGRKYVSLPSGMLCPEENLNALKSDLDRAYKNGIAQDIAENGIANIILRELNNHEAFYNGDIDDTLAALADYPVTRDDVIRIFKLNDNEEL